MLISTTLNLHSRFGQIIAVKLRSFTEIEVCVISSNSFRETLCPLTSYQSQGSLPWKLPCKMHKWTLWWEGCGVLPGVNINWKKKHTQKKPLANSTLLIFKFHDGKRSVITYVIIKHKQYHYKELHYITCSWILNGRYVPCQYYQHHECIISYAKNSAVNLISYLLALSVIKDVGFRVLKYSSGKMRALLSICEEIEDSILISLLIHFLGLH